MRLLEQLKNYLDPKEKREVSRFSSPPLVVFYWNGAAPVPHPIRDVSAKGAYVLTSERWYPGTVVQMRMGLAGASVTEETVMVRAKVVWHGTDGVGVQFVHFVGNEKKMLQELISKSLAYLPPSPVAEEKPQSKVATASTAGQSLVEFALVLPFTLLLFANIVNFAAYIFAWTAIADAARVGVQYAALDYASAGKPNAPTAAAVRTAVQNDAYSLWNRNTVTVAICTKNNTAAAVCDGTMVGTMPVDPEPSLYVITTVDVSYTYTPLINLLSFPKLGIYTTLPSSTIHRKAVMRKMA